MFKEILPRRERGLATCPPTGCAGRRRRRSKRRSTRVFNDLGCRVVRGHPVDAAKGHGFLDSQAAGIAAFRTIDPAIPIVVVEAVWQYTSHVLAGLTRHRGADPHARQLERPVAGPGRHAEPERVADQGRHSLQHDLERGRSTTSSRGAGSRSGSPRGASTTTSATSARSSRSSGRGTCQVAAMRGAELGRELRARAGHHGDLRRGVHGDVQRHHPRRPAARRRRLQGAAEPVGALRGDARGERRDGPAALRLAARRAA